MENQHRSLYERCFEAADNQAVIRLSHLPFESGYYVTEFNVILMVQKPSIYRQAGDHWAAAQGQYALWYDSMTSFCDIPKEIVKELALDKKPIWGEEPNARTL